nr:hypothetical protein [Tanacetum cinerariifolium]
MLKTRILVPKLPKSCARCGHPVDGPYCQGCALLRQELEENLDHRSFVDKIICDLNRAPDSPHLHTISPNQFHCFHCKDVLGNGEACQRCTCTRCGSGLSKGLCYIFGNNQNSLNDSPSSSQSPPHINHHCCYECGDPLDGIFCKRCTCKSCGKDAHVGYNCPPKVPVISNPEPCKNQTIDELPQTLPSFHLTFHSGDESPFTCDSTPNYVDESPNVFNPPPQPLVYSCKFCGNNAHYGHYCTPQAPFIYPELLPPCAAVTPSEPIDSLSMGDEHLDTIPATESDEFIKSSVENLIPIPSESEDQIEDFSKSNDEFSSIDDDSFSIDNIDYVKASPPDSELVSSEVMEIVISEVGGIDDDILLTIKDDILREKLLNVNLLIAKIEALNDNPTPSSDFKAKSSSTSLNSLLEETNTFDNSLPEFETFCFDVEEISSGNTTTHSDISLPEYEVFYDDHVKEISSGSTTTHSVSSLYASFIFDLSINPFPPADRSDFYEFADELIYFISPPKYDCFLFKIEPNSGDYTMDVVEDISSNKELQVHNALPTLQLNLKFQPSSEYLFTYVLCLFLLFLELGINFCNEIFEFLHQHGVIGIDVVSTGGNNGFGADLEFTREIEFEKDFILEDLKSFVGSIVEEYSFGVKNPCVGPSKPR